MDDGLKVLHFLAQSPATAHHVCLELAQRFVADDPPPSLVNRMSQTFLKKKGDLREVYLTMVHSPEFWSEGAYRAKVKTPLELVASALRATAADVDSPFGLTGELQKLGEPLYRKVEPTGYSSANAEWVNSAALLERLNFGLAIGRDRIPGISLGAAWADHALENPVAIATAVIGYPPSADTQRTIQQALTPPAAAQSISIESPVVPPPNNVPLVIGLTLGSPDFQRR